MVSPKGGSMREPWVPSKGGSMREPWFPRCLKYNLYVLYFIYHVFFWFSKVFIFIFI